MKNEKNKIIAGEFVLPKDKNPFDVIIKFLDSEIELNEIFLKAFKL